MMAECKWMQDEICVNADCPMCCDYCPVADTDGVCRYEDRREETIALGGVIKAEAERLAKLFAICLSNNAEILAQEIRRRLDDDFARIEALMKGGEGDG